MTTEAGSLDGLPASLARGKATVKQMKAMTPHQRAIRKCFVCTTTYVNASYAWRCERWHWRDR